MTFNLLSQDVESSLDAFSLQVAVLGKNIWRAWPLIIWETTTAKRNYYRSNSKFGGLGKIWGPGQDLGA